MFVLKCSGALIKISKLKDLIQLDVKRTSWFDPVSFVLGAIMAVIICWIYNYLCNQCLSPLMLWVGISIRARCTTLCDEVCQWLATGWLLSQVPPVSSTNETDRHDIAEILLKVALNIIKQTNKHTYYLMYNVMYMYISWIDPVSFLLFITTPYHVL